MNRKRNAKSKAKAGVVRPKRGSQSRDVYDVLLNKISMMELKPGEALNEVALVQELEVGRTPFREAIQRLVQHGLIVSRPYHPATVAPLNAHEVSQIVEVRVILEAASARYAAQRATGEEKASIRFSNDRYDTAVLSNDPREIILADAALHAAIAEASHNEHLTAAISWNRDFGCRLWNLVVNRGGDLNTKFNAHAALVDAIERGDGDAAEEEMRKHIEIFRQSLSKVLHG